MRAKLGLFTEEDDDALLVKALLDWMQQAKADFTNTFAALSRAESAALSSDASYHDWHQRWQERLGRQPQSASDVIAHMRRHNPAHIPRNHKVEEALAAATTNADLSVMNRLLAVLAKPYDHSQDHPDYRAPSGAEAYRTFCGT
jgi:uncharacterized protein YdiU (UPF0061 family)